MVIRVDVVEAALAARYGDPRPREAEDHRARARRPSFDDALASELATEEQLTLLCGHYEGFDERVHEHLATDVVSIGRYVLSGGELAAMVICDAVIRKLPGALGHVGAVEESFSEALEGAPSTPHQAVRLAATVPDILLSGDHARASGIGGSQGAGNRVAGGSAEGAEPVDRSTLLRYHCRHARRLQGVRLFVLPPRFAPPDHVRRHRQARSVPSRVPGGRPRACALSGRRGHPTPYPVFEGVVIEAPEHGARETFTVAKRSFGVGVERTARSFAEDREDRGGRAR